MPVRQQVPINVPGNSNANLNQSDNELVIRVSSSCCWCYTDSQNVFGGNLPAAGQLHPGEYGPYQPVGIGTVSYCAYTSSSPCPTSGCADPCPGASITATAAGKIVVTRTGAY